MYLSSSVPASFLCLVHLKVCHFLVSDMGRGGGGGGGVAKKDHGPKKWQSVARVEGAVKKMAFLE